MMETPMEAELSWADGQKLLELSAQLYQAVSADHLPSLVLAGLRSLIPTDLAGCHLLHQEQRLLSVCYQPEGAFVPVQHEEFWRLTKTHPLNDLLLAHPARAFLLSDVISETAFLATECYHALYRPLRLNREMVATLPDPCDPGRFLLLSLNRRGSNFTERERGLLNLLLPHIGEARRRLCAQAADPSARRETVKTDSGPEPGVVTRPSEWPDENAFHHWVTRHTPWPLTRRECDVLYWLSQGKTNGEIGCILNMAERTAETHALRLYPKIGVENRYTAIAMISRMTLG